VGAGPEPKNQKAKTAEWRTLDQTWLRIVSNMENVVEDSCHQEINNLAIIDVLRDLVVFE
jgi:hypothetical protein